MKIFLSILFLSTLSFFAVAQEKMIVDQQYNGNTFYSGFSSSVNSISNLPSNIQSNISGYFSKILGSMKDGLKFSHGQIVDLEKYFSDNKETFNYGWVVPKYDLNFIFQDLSIGIKNYYIQLRLDEYGQILACNWPRVNYSNKNEFKSRSEIEKFAINEAKIKGITNLEYKVDLKYNLAFDKLCWVFKFPVVLPNNPRKRFEVFEVDWKSLDIVAQYQIATY